MKSNIWLVVVIALFLYGIVLHLLLSYVLMDINPAKWDRYQRMGEVLCFGIGSAATVLAIWKADEEDKNK